ncbi:unnamed protein product [Cochlearia groenlandica]
MKMYTKSESDMTSLDLSRATYHVQSPSRDSDKSSSAAITHQTTPTESPSHPSSFASRISSGGGFRWKGRRKYHGGGGRWPPCDDLKEESGPYDDDLYNNDNKGVSIATCRFVLGVVAALTLFLLISSVLYAASQSFSPIVYVKGVNVHSFYYWEGLDNTGVPTKIMNIKCSLHITTHNPSKYFNLYISSSSFKLKYSRQFTLAAAQLNSYYQPKQSNHTSSINLVGSMVPLYGAGSDIESSDRKTGVPVKLEFEIKSRANVVGSLVKSRHSKHLSCFFFISSDNNTFVRFNHKTCT